MEQTVHETTVRQFTKLDGGEIGWRSYRIEWGASGPEESDDLQELKSYLLEYEFDLGCGSDECCAIHTWEEFEKGRGVCRQCGSREFVVADIASGLQRLREVVNEYNRRNTSDKQGVTDMKTIWIDDEPYQLDPDELVELGRLYVCVNCFRYLFKTGGGSYLLKEVDGSMVPEDPVETWRILTVEQALRFMSPHSSVVLTEAGEKELASLAERFAVRL